MKHTEQRAWPTFLELPEGRAALVHGSLEDDGQPRYTLNGVELADCDTTIPADLLEAGWFWWGSGLAWRDDAPHTCLLVISGPRSLDDYWRAARVCEAERATMTAPQLRLNLPTTPAQVTRLPTTYRAPRQLVQEVMDL